jgi:hypothetical protein
MDERSFARKPSFAALAGDLTDAFGAVMGEIGDHLLPRRMAAE